MNIQPPSEPNSDKTNSDQINETNPENLPPSILNLKLEVEKIYRDVAQLRKFLQTLVTGLILGIVFSIGVSSWFAYRLLLQERIFTQQLNENTTKQQEILSNLDTLQIQLESQNQQLQFLKQEFPEDLQQLLLNYQQQIQELNDRIEKLKKTETTEKETLSAN